MTARWMQHLSIKKGGKLLELLLATEVNAHILVSWCFLIPKVWQQKRKKKKLQGGKGRKEEHD